MTGCLIDALTNEENSVADNSREQKRRQGLWYLILTGIVGLILVGGLIALQPVGQPLSWAIRGAALLGYLALFLASLASAYMREMFKLFGRPFVRVHHILSVAALILITLHPLLAAVRSSSLLVFLPDFSSVDRFFSLGGRPAWYLIGLASLAGLLRTRIKQMWRVIHYLNYVAFLLVTVHAILIGTDFVGSLVMKVMAVLMALVLVAVFIRKRIQRRRLRRR